MWPCLTKKENILPCTTRWAILSQYLSQKFDGNSLQLTAESIHQTSELPWFTQRLSFNLQGKREVRTWTLIRFIVSNLSSIDGHRAIENVHKPCIGMEPSLDLASGPFFVFDLRERGVESGAIRMLMAIPIADQDEMNFADHQRHFFRIFFIRFLQADPVISRIFQLFPDFLRVTDDNVTVFTAAHLSSRKRSSPGMYL